MKWTQHLEIALDLYIKEMVLYLEKHQQKLLNINKIKSIHTYF